MIFIFLLFAEFIFYKKKKEKEKKKMKINETYEIFQY